MMNIEEELSYITTRIETIDDKGNLYSGTGFFFSYEFDNNKSVPVVVTNKHVVRNMSIGKFVLTERCECENEPKVGAHITLQILNFEKSWYMHPSEDVDICIMPLLPLINEAANKLKKQFYYKTLSKEFIPKEDDYEQINAISEILMIGYPHGIWDVKNNRPIVRKGLTATDIKYDFQGKKEFVIDMACIPGSSGSPIVLYNNGAYRTRSGRVTLGNSQFKFLGILYAGPIMTLEGKVEANVIPTSIMPKSVAKTNVMINLGYCCKSQCLYDFIPLLEKLVNLQN